MNVKELKALLKGKDEKTEVRIKVDTHWICIKPSMTYDKDLDMLFLEIDM